MNFLKSLRPKSSTYLFSNNTTSSQSPSQSLATTSKFKPLNLILALGLGLGMLGGLSSGALAQGDSSQDLSPTPDLTITIDPTPVASQETPSPNQPNLVFGKFMFGLNSQGILRSMNFTWDSQSSQSQTYFPLKLSLEAFGQVYNSPDSSFNLALGFQAGYFNASTTTTGGDSYRYYNEYGSGVFNYSYSYTVMNFQGYDLTLIPRIGLGTNPFYKWYISPYVGYESLDMNSDLFDTPYTGIRYGVGFGVETNFLYLGLELGGTNLSQTVKLHSRDVTLKESSFDLGFVVGWNIFNSAFDY